MTAASMRRLAGKTTALGLLALILTVFVLRSEGRMEYDEATYLARGLFHAAQVQERGNLAPLRLAWSLTFEAPKPPLFHGLLATAALAFGRDRVGAILAAGVVIPLLALVMAIYLLARRAGGAVAGALAVAAYLAMPSALDLGTRLLTETTLAATVVGGTYFAFRRACGGGLADEIGMGILAGLSLLAKLLGPLFLGPVFVVTLGNIWRRQGGKAALRGALVIAAAAALVAAPWYVRNWREAIAFALYARGHVPSLYTRPAWRRPLDFISLTVGWPVAAVITGLTLYRRKLSPLDGGALLLAMTLAAAAVSTLVIVAQPMFDPRFWLPAQALVACALGVAAGRLWQTAASPGGRWVLATAAVALVAVSASRLAMKPRPQTSWPAAGAIRRLAADLEPSPLLCTLGNNPDWNVFKLQLFAELSGVRPRPKVADLLVNGRAVDFERRLAGCDAVFALPVDRVPPQTNQRAYNADLGLGWSLLGRHASELRRAPSLAATLGSRARPELLIRRIPARRS